MLQKRLYFKKSDDSEIIALPAGYPPAYYLTLLRNDLWTRCSKKAYRRLLRRNRQARKSRA